MAEMTIPQAYGLAVEHQRAGRLNEAEALYRQIVKIDPNHADTWRMLAGIAFQLGRHTQAIELLTRSISLQPKSADAFSDLGIVLATAGRADEAAGALRQAIALQPNHSDAHYNLGRLLTQQNRVQEATAAYEQALRIRPDFADAHNNLGELHRRQGRLDLAESNFRRAIELRSTLIEAHFNLGVTLHELDRPDAALACLNRVVQARPSHAQAWNAIGNIHRENNRLDHAMAAYTRAMELQPDMTEARWHMSLALLASGDFRRGWFLYEARRQLQGVWRDPAFEQPAWNGEDLDGRRILLWAEQGFGDTIQFIRYVPLVKARGGRVLVRCRPELTRLISTQAGIERVLSEEEHPPSFDVHCPLMSLPRVFGTTIETVPRTVPYLSADPAEVAAWRERIAGDGAKRRIGLAWATNPNAPSSHGRRIGLHSMAPLAELRDTVFYSLQKDAAAEAASPPAGMRLIDPTSRLNDFADTAALIGALDLVITCDTAVAHLAGAMGATVLVALPWSAPWRWMLEVAETPWYPTMRLFRQPRRDDWETPMRAMIARIERKPDHG